MATLANPHPTAPLLALALAFGVGCSRQEGPPPAATTIDAAGAQPVAVAPPSAMLAPGAAAPAATSGACDASKKPASPYGAVDTPSACSAAGGRWTDNWGKPDGAGTGWIARGRGNYVFRGCTNLRATDAGGRCLYDWDCQGVCDPTGTCSKLVDPAYPAGHRTRCENGRVRTVMVD